MTARKRRLTKLNDDDDKNDTDDNNAAVSHIDAKNIKTKEKDKENEKERKNGVKNLPKNGRKKTKIINRDEDGDGDDDDYDDEANRDVISINHDKDDKEKSIEKNNVVDKKKESKGKVGGGSGGNNILNLKDIKENDLLSRTEYLKVLKVSDIVHDGKTGKNIRVQVLRGHKPEDMWDIRTNDPLEACSSEFSTKTLCVSKTEMANRMMECKDDCFTVKFRPVLTPDILAPGVEEFKHKIGEAKDIAAITKILREVIAGVPIRTLKGRLLKPNTVLGHSLVDDLEQTNTQKTAFRNVVHEGLTELITRNTKYILK